MYTYKLNIESLTWEGQDLQRTLKGIPSLVFQSEGRISPSVWEAIGVDYIFNDQESRYEFLKLPKGQGIEISHFAILPSNGIPILSVDAISDLNEIADNKEFRRLFAKHFFYEILTVSNLIKLPKMYVLIKDAYKEVDWEEICDEDGYVVDSIKIETSQPLSAGRAVVAASHASLSTWLRFANHPSPTVRFRIKSWARNSFVKVICKVSEEEFQSAKMCALHNVITESSLGNAEVAIAFLPRHEYPEFFSGFHLYK